MTKEQVLDEVRRLDRDDQMEVLERLVDMVARPLTQEEERGIVEALDEAERGELIDGPAAFEAIRRGARGK